MKIRFNLRLALLELHGVSYYSVSGSRHKMREAKVNQPKRAIRSTKHIARRNVPMLDPSLLERLC